MTDLTLKQFGIPVTDNWSGTGDAYVLKMAEDAPDQTLIGLAQHLGLSLEASEPSHIEAAFWRKGMFRLLLPSGGP